MKKVRNIIFILCLTLFLSLFVSCNDKENNNNNNNTEQPTEVVDYVGQLKLDKTVTASDSFFESEGVGLATLVRNVDGDTAVFKTSNQEFTARFLGVDTPESTGQVEKWGKTASLFTANKLNNAVSIVVQSDGGAAQKDTTGSRYLTFVWYKATADSDYRLLNLELVQEGLSFGKTSTITKYKNNFVSAHNQAMAQKLRLWGNEADENYFAGSALQVSVKYILENKTELLSQNAKVRFEATVVRIDGLYVYVQDYDGETDKVYSILMYLGYNFTSNKLQPGYRLSICGNIQEYGGYVQISGLTDLPVAHEDNLKFIEKANVKETNVSVSDVLNASELDMRKFVSLENIKVTSVYTTASGDSKGAMTITGKVGEETITIRTSVLRKDYEAVTEDYFKNKTISVKGLIEEYNETKQIKVVSIDDVTIIE